MFHWCLQLGGHRIQTYTDIVGSVPGRRNKVSCNLFAGGESFFQFVFFLSNLCEAQ